MNEYFKIRDYCRQGLIKHLENACNIIPRLSNYNILDIGCGTGVSTLWLAENFSGNITAIDNDFHAIEYLQQKIKERNLQHRIKTICISFDEFEYLDNQYDIILAEGFLNVVGFELGFERLIGKVKNRGYFIIHDEYNDNDTKIAIIQKNNCEIISTIYLDETIWWNDFYRQLEIEINNIVNDNLRSLFVNELNEIEQYKINSALFKSIYYVVLKS